MNSADTPSDNFRSIAMFENSEMPFLYPEMAKYLRLKHSARVVLFTKTIVNADYYRNEFPDHFDDVQVAPDPLFYFRKARHKQLDQEVDVVQRARKIEQDLSCSINSFRVSHRQLGRGFMLGGPGHPKTRMQSLFTDTRILAAYVCCMESWLKYFEKDRFSLVFDAPVWIEAHLKSQNVPWRKFLTARHKSYNYWMTSYTGDSVLIASRLLELAGLHMSHADIEIPKRQYDVAFNLDSQFRKTNTLRSVVWRSFLRFARFGYGIMRGYDSAWGYLPTSDSAYLFRRWRDEHTYQKLKTVRIEDYKNRDYVLFPLQMEPELSLQGFSPEFYSQHTALASIAGALPAGVRLVVKEHKYALGRRPAGFFEAIQSLGNVDFADLYEPGFEWSEHANAVATITSTAGFEAAIMGVPVISFGTHNVYGPLDHVFVCDHLSKVPAALKTCLSDGFDHAEAKENGKRFCQAIETACVDMGNYQKKDPATVDEELLGRVVENLLETIRVEQAKVPDHA